ncbi:MAG: hypothetical protein RL685_4588 [Pseudomonadota bacterium]|jgi:hypothetical protein
MSFIIPTLSGADAVEAYDQRTALEGTEYLWSFRYNLRRELWSFSIVALDGTPILTGQTVHVGIALNRRAVRGPPGVLLAISETDDIEPPGLYELGARVKLCYLSEAEVAELEST